MTDYSRLPLSQQIDLSSMRLPGWFGHGRFTFLPHACTGTFILAAYDSHCRRI